MATRAERLIRRQIIADNIRRDAQIERFTNRLEGLLQRGVTDVVRGLPTGTENVLEAANRVDQLIESLEELGLGDSLDELEDLYFTEFAAIANQFERDTDTDIPLAPIDAEVAEAVISFDSDIIEGQIFQFANEVKREVIRSTILGVAPDIDQLSTELVGRRVSNIKTEVNTGMQSFNRTVTAIKAVETFGENPNFLYVGPFDKVTRPFCGEVLTTRTPPIYSLREILGLDNGQGLSALEFGGGFNCRHEWRPVSPELEKELRGG